MGVDRRWSVGCPVRFTDSDRVPIAALPVPPARHGHQQGRHPAQRDDHLNQTDDDWCRREWLHVYHHFYSIFDTKWFGSSLMFQSGLLIVWSINRSTLTRLSKKKTKRRLSVDCKWRRPIERSVSAYRLVTNISTATVWFSSRRHVQHCRLITWPSVCLCIVRLWRDYRHQLIDIPHPLDGDRIHSPAS